MLIFRKLAFILKKMKIKSKFLHNTVDLDIGIWVGELLQAKIELLE